MDAFGDDDDAFLGFGVDGFDVGDEGVHIECDLRKVDEVGAVALIGRERSDGGEPTGVAAHALDDGDHTGIVDAERHGRFP